MAADPTAGDIFMVSIRQSLLAQRLLSTFHVRIVTMGGSFPTLDGFSNELYAKLNNVGDLIPSFKAVIPTNCFVDEVWIQRIYPTRARKRVYVDGAPGTGFGTANTANVQGSITRQDDDALKRSTGHLHPVIAPIPTTTISNGELTAGPLAAMSTLASKMLGTVTLASGVQFQYVLFHKKDVPGLLKWSPIVATRRETSVRVMRRRTLRVGE
jgi:hypothetical protein